MDVEPLYALPKVSGVLIRLDNSEAALVARRLGQVATSSNILIELKEAIDRIVASL